MPSSVLRTMPGQAASSQLPQLLPLLLLVAQASFAAGSGCRYESPFASTTSDPTYATQSMANLSDYRSGILKRAHQLFHSRVTPEALKLHPEVTATVLQDTKNIKAWAEGWPIFQPFFSHVACPPPFKIVYYGKPRVDPNVYEDGGKWACGPLPEKDCVVYSLGSALDYTFETALMNQTNCQVFTFDCTVPGTSIFPGRHHFEKLCIGDQPPIMPDSFMKHNTNAGFQFATLPAIMKRLGHKEVTYLKIDIEGSEFDVMEHWREDDTMLPLQIGIELHQLGLPHRYTDVDMFMRHMAGLGYATVLKEDNIHCSICTELVLLKVEQRTCDPSGGGSHSSGGGGGGGAGAGYGVRRGAGMLHGHNRTHGDASGGVGGGAASAGGASAVSIDDVMAVLKREQVDYARLAEGLKARKVDVGGLVSLNLREASELMSSVLGAPVPMRQVSRLQVVAASLQHGGMAPHM